MKKVAQGGYIYLDTVRCIYNACQYNAKFRAIQISRDSSWFGVVVARGVGTLACVCYAA